MKSEPPSFVTLETNRRIAAFTGPSFHEGSGSSGSAPAAVRSAIAATARTIRKATRARISDSRAIRSESARRHAELFHEVDLLPRRGLVRPHCGRGTARLQ